MSLARKWHSRSLKVAHNLAIPRGQRGVVRPRLWLSNLIATCISRLPPPLLLTSELHQSRQVRRVESLYSLRLSLRPGSLLHLPLWLVIFSHHWPFASFRFLSRFTNKEGQSTRTTFSWIDHAPFRSHSNFRSIREWIVNSQLCSKTSIRLVSLQLTASFSKSWRSSRSSAILSYFRDPHRPFLSCFHNCVSLHLPAPHFALSFRQLFWLALSAVNPLY